MGRLKSHTATVGAVFWIGVIWLAIAALQRVASPATASSSGRAQQLLHYGFHWPILFDTPLSGQNLRRGDPIFYADGDQWIQVGYVEGVSPEAELARILWYHSSLDPRQFELHCYQNHGKLNDVLEVLLPPEKRQRIQDKLSLAMREHGSEVAAAFRPVIEQSLRESAPLLESALKQSLRDHEDEFKQIGERWEREIVKARLVPLLRREVLPSVRAHAEPLAQQIGRELWDRASLWRFGWRAIYDKSPLPDRDLLKREWERFVEKEVIPVFESHTDDIIDAQKKIVLEILENKPLRAELEVVLKEVASDREFQSLLNRIVRESVIDNQHLTEVWTRNLKSEQAQAAVRIAGERMEPIVRQIGDDLFGTREGGIDPDFARVLRNQILGKDKRWVVATAAINNQQNATTDAVGSAQPWPQLQPGRQRTRYPLVNLAGPDAER